MTIPINERDYEQLNAYLDGELSNQERAAFEVRLAQDVALQQELQALRITSAILGLAESVRAPRNFTLDRATYGQLHKKRSLWDRLSLPGWQIMVPAGVAVIAAFVCIGALIFSGGLGSGGVAMAPAPAADMAEQAVEEEAAPAEPMAEEPSMMLAPTDTEGVENAEPEMEMPAEEEPQEAPEEELMEEDQDVGGVEADAAAVPAEEAAEEEEEPAEFAAGDDTAGEAAADESATAAGGGGEPPDQEDGEGVRMTATTPTMQATPEGAAAMERAPTATPVPEIAEQEQPTDGEEETTPDDDTEPGAVEPPINIGLIVGLVGVVVMVLALGVVLIIRSRNQ